MVNGYARVAVTLVIAVAMIGAAAAQSGDGLPPVRTLAEIKTEVQARADRNAYPVTGLDPADVRTALAGLNSLDRDAWAAAWTAIGDRYARQAAAADTAGAPALWYKVFLYDSFARWPVPDSPGKAAAYRKALAAYRIYARSLSPALQTVRLPLDGKTIVAYMQMPAGVARAPVVLAIGGLDSRKEDLAQRFASLLKDGVGYVAVDMPGTGEAPVKIGAGAEVMFSRVLDYLATRPDVDTARVLVYGGSFGGYWAVKVGIADRQRVAAVVAQSPPVDGAFAPDFLRSAFATKEYLFDRGPALMSMYAGVTTPDDLLRIAPVNSLVAQGLLNSPMPPMLVIGGVKDTQVPIADISLLLTTGTTPKNAWINPSGGHMGRETQGWTDATIFTRITTPWIERQLGVAHAS